MQFKAATICAILSAVLSPALAIPANGNTSKTLKVTFDTFYDNPSTSLLSVACSNGDNGLISKGFTTFGSLPTRAIGGSQFIAGWNSDQCGSCWKLTYKGKSVHLLAVDTAGVGFNIAKGTFDYLADASAQQAGSFEAAIESLPASGCGF